jgi:hypothetical protein
VIALLNWQASNRSVRFLCTYPSMLTIPRGFTR